MANRASKLALRAAAAAVLTGITALTTTDLLRAQPAGHLQLVYLAPFPNGSLNPSVDHLHFGTLKKGDGQVAGSNPTWTPKKGAVELGVTKTEAGDATPVSAGLFATPTNFGPGSVFSIQATFIRPIGPHGVGNLWAASVGGRTGGKDDLGSETRAVVTLQVRQNAARINVRGVTVPVTGTDIPPAVYDRIFDTANPEPFALELLVDRSTGKGTATFKAGSYVLSRNVSYSIFQATSGPPITAVGAALAINTSAAGAHAAVQVRELRISTPKP